MKLANGVQNQDKGKEQENKAEAISEKLGTLEAAKLRRHQISTLRIKIAGGALGGAGFLIFVGFILGIFYPLRLEVKESLI